MVEITCMFLSQVYSFGQRFHSGLTTLLFLVVLGRDLTSFSLPPPPIFLFFFLSSFGFSFLLQLHQPTFYTPSLVMVSIIFVYFLTLISSLWFKRDACSWVEGLLFGKRERIYCMQLIGFALGKSEIAAIQGYLPPIWGRGKVILPLSLHLYPLLNERGCLCAGYI